MLLIKKVSKKIFSLSLCFLLVACGGGGDSVPPKSSKAKLLFSSGFEGKVKIGKPYYEYRPIEGKDSETGFSWPITALSTAKESGLHYINNNDYLTIKTEIQSVKGHNNKPTKALYSEVTCLFPDKTQCKNDDTQNPYEILEIKDGKRDLYIRYWIKLDANSFDKLDGWRTFFEWKTKTYGEGTGFRLISYIYSDENEKGKLFWHWQGDHDSETEADWEFDNKDIPVPLDEWFLTEFYWSWNEGNGGRALWKINGQVVKDYLGPTAAEPNLAPALSDQPIDFIMLTQIYGDSNPKHQWIDDIEIWDGLPDKAK
jgi:hypothetical protein